MFEIVDVKQYFMLCLSTYQENAAQSGLPEKPITHQPVKKFLAFHRTKMFITVFTKSRHLSLP
jgi:hypothetical protein